MEKLPADPHILSVSGSIPASHHLIAKDMDGNACGQAGAGVYATSAEGVKWDIPERAPAYRKEYESPDLGIVQPAFLERFQRFVTPEGTAHAVLAVGQGDGSYRGITKSYNICLPLIRHLA